MYAAKLVSVCHMWPYCASTGQQVLSQSHHPNYSDMVLAGTKYLLSELSSPKMEQKWNSNSSNTSLRTPAEILHRLIARTGN